jgi:hypothetical protein
MTYTCLVLFVALKEDALGFQAYDQAVQQDAHDSALPLWAVKTFHTSSHYRETSRISVRVARTPALVIARTVDRAYASSRSIDLRRPRKQVGDLLLPHRYPLSHLWTDQMMMSSAQRWPMMWKAKLTLSCEKRSLRRLSCWYRMRLPAGEVC